MPHVEGPGELQAVHTRGHSEPSSRFHYQTCKETFSPLSYQFKHCFTIRPESLGLTELLAFTISRSCVTYTKKPYK